MDLRIKERSTDIYWRRFILPQMEIIGFCAVEVQLLALQACGCPILMNARGRQSSALLLKMTITISHNFSFVSVLLGVHLCVFNLSLTCNCSTQWNYRIQLNRYFTL